MKKTALVAIMAVALVFAFTAVAFAEGTSSDYIDWDAASDPGNSGSAATPHYDYATTTQKCLVCHAAHKAAPGGEALLEATVKNACVWCHIDAGPATTKVYGSTPANFTVVSDQAHNISCTECHAVHGANTIVNSNGLYPTSILKDMGAQTTNSMPYDYSATTVAEEYMTAYCSSCHPYYTGTYAVAGATGEVMDSWTSTGPWNSHIMTSDFTSYGDTTGGPDYATYEGKVAWAGTPYCTSCHDDATGFPHYTGGARFMKSAVNVEAKGTASGAASPTEDGVCLKCHASSVDGGVGVDF